MKFLNFKIFCLFASSFFAFAQTPSTKTVENHPMGAFASPPLLAGRSWTLGEQKGDHFFQRKNFEKLSMDQINAFCPKTFRVANRKDFVDKLQVSDIDGSLQGEFYYAKTNENLFSRFHYCYLESAKKVKILFQSTKKVDAKTIPETQKDFCQLLCVNEHKSK